LRAGEAKERGNPVQNTLAARKSRVFFLTKKTFVERIAPGWQRVCKAGAMPT
jgi:hypothetical protein